MIIVILSMSLSITCTININKKRKELNSMLIYNTKTDYIILHIVFI